MIGNWRTEKTYLFKDDADRECFLEQLADRVEQYNVRLYLFVLMTNHFHLVFETPEGNCSRFMHSLTTAYTVYYNLRHNRHGHLLDGRYKAKPVEGDDYLLALSRYVHLNPVSVASEENKPIGERIKTLRAHRWSSYPSYIGMRKPFDFVEYGPLLGEMAGKERDWSKRYREFVESGLAGSDASSTSYDGTADDFKVALKLSPRSIGSGAFRAWVDDMHQELLDKRSGPEDVSFRHTTEPLPPETILDILSDALGVNTDVFLQRRRNCPFRAIAARMLIRFGGRTQRQAAEILNMRTGGAVSAQARKFPKLIAENRRLRNTVLKLEKRLQRLKEEKASPAR